MSERPTRTTSTDHPVEENGQGARAMTGITSGQHHFQIASWTVFAAAALSALVIGVYALTHLGTGTWLNTAGQAVAVLAAIGFALMYWWTRRRRLGPSTIRGRLLIGFVVICLLPAIAISAGGIVIGFYNGRQQALDRLESLAALREIEITTWIHSLQNELVVALNEEYALDRAHVVLDLARDNKYYDYFNKAMRYRLQRFAEQSPQIEELFLVDLEGRVVVSSEVEQEGTNCSGEAFFEQGQRSPYAALPFSSTAMEEAVVIPVIPVVADDGDLLGILAGRAQAETLFGILGERTGLGDTGKTYLVGRDHVLLPNQHTSSTASGRTDTAPQEIHSTAIDTVLEDRASGLGVYEDYRGVSVVGVYHWLPELGVAIIAEQDLSEAFRAMYANLGINVGIALVSVLLAVAVSLVITRSISTPLIDLVQTATQIAAGDLKRVAKVTQEDEVGVLARAFNTMTGQLRDLIDGLEQRVAERTHALREANEALRRRALQLETSARVSRGITSILDIDDLLKRVVELIRDAFGHYHVHIFLIDKEATQLVLRASTGAVSPHGQRLDLGGQSLNAHVAQTNEALAVNDVTRDPRYLADALLPDVRSELVIPLRIADEVIGTLAVQSSKLNAFRPEDVLVIQSLGDQVAIAIENARLYDRSRELATLEERHRLARELHDSVTQSLFSLDLHAKAIATHLRKDPEHAEMQIQQLRQITHDALQEMRSLIFDLRPPSLDDGGLVAALRQQLDLLRRPEGPQLVLEAVGECRLPVEVERDLLRIAQEAVRNAIAHANAQRVTVRLSMDSQWVTLCITDDGRGFDLASLGRGHRGFGLAGMRERAEALEGSLEIRSQQGAGTQIEVKVPI